MVVIVNKKTTEQNRVEQYMVFEVSSKGRCEQNCLKGKFENVVVTNWFSLENIGLSRIP